jgi:hypothetical protein
VRKKGCWRKGEEKYDGRNDEAATPTCTASYSALPSLYSAACRRGVFDRDFKREEKRWGALRERLKGVSSTKSSSTMASIIDDSSFGPKGGRLWRLNQLAGEEEVQSSREEKKKRGDRQRCRFVPFAASCSALTTGDVPTPPLHLPLLNTLPTERARDPRPDKRKKRPASTGERAALVQPCSPSLDRGAVRL